MYVAHDNVSDLKSRVSIWLRAHIFYAAKLHLLVFLSYNMTWPKEMDCDNFSDDSDTCMWSTGNGQDKPVRY